MGFSAVVNGKPVKIEKPRWILLNRKKRLAFLTPLFGGKMEVTIANGFDAEIISEDGETSNKEAIISRKSFSIFCAGSNGKIHKMFFVFSEDEK
jgi:hypothetical protein